jgi:di/tricarboxylate transporter
LTLDQGIVFAILGATLALFIWNRWRYDIVSLMALLVATIAGVVPSGNAFVGFGHPAVITVAAVLVLSRGLLNAGVVDLIARRLVRVGDRPIIQVLALTTIVTVCSGFMNNVGALALLMPVAIWMSRKSGVSPSLLLMPLAFGSLLGGMTTLIGTPPNIIIASFREETGAGKSFGMFDFAYVGGPVALAGLIFLVIAGWRLAPKRQTESPPEDLFSISDYISEVRVTAESPFRQKTLHALLEALESDLDVNILGLVRGEKKLMVPSNFEVLREGDILIVETDPEGLKGLLDAAEFKLANSQSDDEDGESKSDSKPDITPGDVQVVEAIITADSSMIGQSATSLDLRERHGINVLAVARRGQRLKLRLGKIRFAAGDILLLQGTEERLAKSLAKLGCLKLADRGLRFGNPPQILLSLGIFLAAIVVVATGLLTAEVGLACGALAMVLSGLLSPGESYKSIDWPVIVLLAAMIPIGEALETTGGAELVANQLARLAQGVTPLVTVGIVLIVSMLLSNVINNAAAAILMAPIAISIARSMDANTDPLLMAVAIGASCAFMTPIGHQSNAMVMTPGGYEFGDYWRMGLPMSAIVVVVAVPLLVWVWGI